MRNILKRIKHHIEGRRIWQAKMSGPLSVRIIKGGKSARKANAQSNALGAQSNTLKALNALAEQGETS